MAMPSGSIPLDEAALVLAQCHRPSLDLVGEMSRLDDLAATCPSPTVDGVVRHLFHDLGFTGNVGGYDEPTNSFLDVVLDRRSGIPISLSVLTIEVARRVGVSLHGVGLPGHFIVGVTGQDTYIDGFGRGTVLDTAGVRSLFQRVSGGSPHWDPNWLAPVDNRSLLLRMLNNLKGSYQRRNDLIGLRWVMQLRARVSAGVADGERDEFRRLMAPTN